MSYFLLQFAAQEDSFSNERESEQTKQKQRGHKIQLFAVVKHSHEIGKYFKMENQITLSQVRDYTSQATTTTSCVQKKPLDHFFHQ